MFLCLVFFFSLGKEEIKICFAEIIPLCVHVQVQQ